jgi:peptide-methionine (R)-S-oxide reductase
MVVERIERSEEEWRKLLTPMEYHVLREGGTEPPFSGALVDCKRDGKYVCAACGWELFSSEDKFDSGSGWPSFSRTLHEDSVESLSDLTFGMVRTEVRCARCGGHLGHVFDDGPRPTGKRFCMNSISLKFIED